MTQTRQHIAWDRMLELVDSFNIQSAIFRYYVDENGWYNYMLTTFVAQSNVMPKNTYNVYNTPFEHLFHNGPLRDKTQHEFVVDYMMREFAQDLRLRRVRGFEAITITLSEEADADNAVRAGGRAAGEEAAVDARTATSKIASSL